MTSGYSLKNILIFCSLYSTKDHSIVYRGVLKYIFITRDRNDYNNIKINYKHKKSCKTYKIVFFDKPKPRHHNTLKNSSHNLSENQYKYIKIEVDYLETNA